MLTVRRFISVAILSSIVCAGAYSALKASKSLDLGGKAMTVAAKSINSGTINSEAKKTNIPSVIYLLLLALLAGFLVALTPCFYSMMPITLGVLFAHRARGIFSHFLLVTSYVLGFSSVYAVLGYLVATSRVAFGAWMSSPLAVGILIIIFVYLALSMFGIVRLPMIRREQSVTTNVDGSLVSAFFFGLVSGFVVSPCMTPPLVLLLSYVGRVGSPFIGLLALLFFALGKGLLLVIVGTFTGLLSALPKPGSWMLEINRGIGFLIFMIAISFLKPFIALWQLKLLYSGLFFTIAAYYWASVRVRGTFNLIGWHRRYRDKEMDPADKFGIFHFVDVGALLRGVLMVAAFTFGMVFMAQSYLRYKNTTLGKVIIHIVTSAR